MKEALSDVDSVVLTLVEDRVNFGGGQLCVGYLCSAIDLRGGCLDLRSDRDREVVCA